MSSLRSFSRRQMLRVAGVLGLGSLLPAARETALAFPGQAVPRAGASQRAGTSIYQALGVRPIINGRGTLTIIGGSMELPEVRAAKDVANQQYVQLDELMDAAGKRLAELTGAEWGMVSAGCSAAMSHATAACVAGGNPELHVRIPDLTGFAKDEVIMPTHSRNVYDAAIRAVGVRVIEVGTPEDLRLALGPRTRSSVTAAERSSAGPRAQGCCSAARTWSRLPGSTARRIAGMRAA